MNLIEEHWQIVTATVGFIVWLVRLEGQGSNREKRLTYLETQVENLESGLVKEMSQVKEALARIEGYLKAKHEFTNDR
jgi:hypothetical protein